MKCIIKPTDKRVVVFYLMDTLIDTLVAVTHGRELSIKLVWGFVGCGAAVRAALFRVASWIVVWLFVCSILRNLCSILDSGLHALLG